jgi:hypothetical protein
VRDTITAWVGWSVAIIVFVASSAGSGYLAGVLARRRAWSRLAGILMSAVIAFIWPAVIIGDAFYGAVTYQRLDANDPADAPVYVLIGSILVGGVLFVLSLPLALIGVHLARRGESSRGNSGETPPNPPYLDSSVKKRHR